MAEPSEDSNSVPGTKISWNVINMVILIVTVTTSYVTLTNRVNTEANKLTLLETVVADNDLVYKKKLKELKNEVDINHDIMFKKSDATQAIIEDSLKTIMKEESNDITNKVTIITTNLNARVDTLVKEIDNRRTTSRENFLNVGKLSVEVANLKTRLYLEDLAKINKK